MNTAADINCFAKDWHEPKTSNPRHGEEGEAAPGAMAVARGAIDAHDFEAARQGGRLGKAFLKAVALLRFDVLLNGNEDIPSSAHASPWSGQPD